jgi:hypothetical protein
MTPLKPKEANEFMSRSGSRFIVLPTELATQIFPHCAPSCRTYRAEGFNVAKWRWVDLTMFVKLD